MRYFIIVICLFLVAYGSNASQNEKEKQKETNQSDEEQVLLPPPGSYRLVDVEILTSGNISTTITTEVSGTLIMFIEKLDELKYLVSSTGQASINVKGDISIIGCPTTQIYEITLDNNGRELDSVKIVDNCPAEIPEELDAGKERTYSWDGSQIKLSTMIPYGTNLITTIVYYDKSDW